LHTILAGSDLQPLHSPAGKIVQDGREPKKISKRSDHLSLASANHSR